LAEIKKNMDRIEQSNTQVFALSVDIPERSAGFRQAMQFPFELLCDPEKKVVKLFHLLNPHEHDGIAYPAIFVINPEGRICYRSLDRTATRVQLTEVLAFLDKLQEDPAFQEQGGKKKAFIVPLPAEMWQILQNMIFRGSGADWKHYFKYTFVYTPQNMFKLVTKPFRKK
jgi:hypothetical protein